MQDGDLVPQWAYSIKITITVEEKAPIDIDFGLNKLTRYWMEPGDNEITYI